MPNETDMLLRELGLSRRIYNILKANGYKTIPEIMVLSDAELRAIKGIGDAAFSEIKQKLGECSIRRPKKLIQAINAGKYYDTAYKTTFTNNLEYIANGRLSNAIADEFASVSIDVLDLPLRTRNVLKLEHIDTIGQLDTLTDSELAGARSLGMLRARELKGKVVEFKNNSQKNVVNSVFDIDIFIGLLYKDINKYRRKMLSEEYISKKVNEIINKFDVNKYAKDYLEDSYIMSCLYDDSAFENTIKEIIKYVLSSVTISCSFIEFSKYLPKSFLCTKRLHEVLRKMVADCEIDFYLGRYTAYYAPLDEYLNKLPVEEKNVLSKRMEGQSCNSIDKELGAKGRTAKLMDNIIRKRPKVYENRYVYWFRNYDMDVNVFCKLFDVHTYVYDYISIMYNKGHGTLDEMRNDEYMTDELLEKLNNIISKKEV